MFLNVLCHIGISIIPMEKHVAQPGQSGFASDHVGSLIVDFSCGHHGYTRTVWSLIRPRTVSAPSVCRVMYVFSLQNHAKIVLNKIVQFGGLWDHPTDSGQHLLLT